MMNPWVKRRWLKALRSGEYVKGAGFLGNEQQGYCCLGVLACEMVPEFVGDEGSFTVVVDGEKHYLPDDLTLLYGLDRTTTGHLANLNDDASTFEPVIAYIEENL